MGSAGDGLQQQPAVNAKFLCHGILGQRRLSTGIYLPQQAGQRQTGDGGIHFPLLWGGDTEDQRFVGLLQFSLCVEGAQKVVNVGIFCQQHHAEGIPVQSGHRVKGAVLAGFFVVTQNEVCQCAGIDCPGGVDQHPRRLVHAQNVRVFVQDGEVTLLRRVLGQGIVQQGDDLVAHAYGEIRMAGDAVDIELLCPFQPVHQPGGQTQLLLQKAAQPPIPLGNMANFHNASSFYK